MPGSINFDEMKAREQALQARNIQKLEQDGKVKFDEPNRLKSRGKMIQQIAITIICGACIITGLLILNSFMN